MFRCFTLLLFTFYIHQGYGQITYKRAQEQYGVKKYNDAIGILDKLILKNDRDTHSYFLRAKSYFELHHGQKAHDDLSRFLELEPKNGLAYLYRGQVMESTGQFFDAINDFNEAIKYGKDTVISSGYFHRGSCYMSINNKLQAFTDFTSAYRLNPTNKYIRLNYATSLCNIDSIDQGIKIFKQIIQEDDKDFIAHQNIGYYSMQREQYDTALVYYNKTLKINPKAASTYNNRGYLKFKMGNTKEALNDINASLKMDKTNPFAYKNRALISISEGKTMAACEDLIKALSLIHI